MDNSITIDNPFWDNFLNILENTMHIILDKSFKVAVTGSNSSTAGKPGWYQMFLRRHQTTG